MNNDMSMEKMLPQMRVMQTVTGYAFSFVIKAAMEIDLFNKLKKESNTAKQLSERLKVDASALRRLIRALAFIGLIEEEGGMYKLSDGGQAFAAGNKGKSIEPLAKYMLDDKLVSSMMALSYSIKTGKSTFEKINGVSWYEYGKENPSCLKIMDKAMENYSKINLDTVLVEYPFSNFKLIVDVAGGNGQILSEIIKKNESCKGILFDQKATIERVNSNLKQYGLEKRCELVSGDMFKKVPAGGDLYLISKVLNDWEDDEVINILKNIGASMNDKSKLIIIETIEQDNNYSPQDIYRDLLFLTLSAGKLRNKEQFKKLILASGLEVIDIKLTKERFSIIECRLA